MSELNAPDFDKTWTGLLAWSARDTETASSHATPKLLDLSPCAEL